MVTKVDTPDRRQLAALAGDDPAIMRFLERLFDQAGTDTPTDVANIDADLTQIKEDVAENAGDITSNAAGIESNAADIAANTALIARFTSTQAISSADSPFTPIATGTLLCDAIGGAIVIKLNPANTGVIINVKKIDASQNAVILTPATGTIDGSATAPITTPFLTLTVISDGTDWFIL